MYINKIGGEIKFTAEKVLSADTLFFSLSPKNLYNKSYLMLCLITNLRLATYNLVKYHLYKPTKIFNF